MRLFVIPIIIRRGTRRREELPWDASVAGAQGPLTAPPLPSARLSRLPWLLLLLLLLLLRVLCNFGFTSLRSLVYAYLAS